MTDIVTYLQRQQFVDGLLGYLDIRQWAFEKIRANPVGSNLIDLRMYHYLYFSNLFGAVEIVQDYLSIPTEKKAFADHLQQGFPKPGDYIYARELRNSIVHRGLDPTMQGTEKGDFVFALCPPIVFKRNSGDGYVCSTPLLVDLAAACNKASNMAILKIIEREGLLDAASHILEQEPIFETFGEESHIPDWAEDMAEDAFATTDFEGMAIEIAQARVQKLRSLLGASEA
jgi:hypothetical protein